MTREEARDGLFKVFKVRRGDRSGDGGFVLQSSQLSNLVRDATEWRLETCSRQPQVQWLILLLFCLNNAYNQIHYYTE